MIESRKTVNGIIVLGSARSDGHTRSMVEKLADETGMEVVDLNDHDIGYFEYNNYDRGDDFIPVIERILRHEVIVFATPVYWYNMSAIMKNFFDRITDLLRLHQDLGRQFRTKQMAVLSCSATAGHDEEFERPFRRTAQYLGMGYAGHLSTWTFDRKVSQEVGDNIRAFAEKLSSSFPTRSDVQAADS